MKPGIDGLVGDFLTRWVMESQLRLRGTILVFGIVLNQDYLLEEIYPENYTFKYRLKIECCSTGEGNSEER